MEKTEIIERLSSYFRLKGPEAEGIYKEIFEEYRDTHGGKPSKSKLNSPGNLNGNNKEPYFCGQDIEDIRISIQTKDANQLELDYLPKAAQYSAEIEEMERELKRQNVLVPVHEPVPDTNINESIIETDKSYYIWHKDAEPMVQDMETLSCEYELLYQAAKEVEYKSRMKIYAVSFISFFSFVLLMLILSPLIYRQFFFAEQFPSLQQTFAGATEENKAVPNDIGNLVLAENKTPFAHESHSAQDTGSGDFVRAQSDQNAGVEPISTENPQPVVTDGRTGELRRTIYGWADDKHNVVYIQMENGKYSIQESSWDSFGKADKRKSEIESLNIPGLKGSIDEVDLGLKGKWYRLRFGEFNSIDEARRIVEEFLRL